MDKQEFLEMISNQNIQEKNIIKEEKIKDELIEKIETKFNNRIEILQEFYKSLYDDFTNSKTILENAIQELKQLSLLYEHDREHSKEFRENINKQINDAIQNISKSIVDNEIKFDKLTEELKSIKDLKLEVSNLEKEKDKLFEHNINLKTDLELFKKNILQQEENINENFKRLTDSIKQTQKDFKESLNSQISQLKLVFENDTKHYKEKLEEKNSNLENKIQDIHGKLTVLSDLMTFTTEQDEQLKKKIKELNEKLELLEQEKTLLKESADETTQSFKDDFQEIENLIKQFEEKIKYIEDTIKQSDDKLKDIEVKIKEQEEKPPQEKIVEKIVTKQEKINEEELVKKFKPLINEKIKSIKESQNKLNEKIQKLNDLLDNKISEVSQRMQRHFETFAGSGIGLHELHDWLKTNNYISMGDDGTFKINGNNLPNNIKNISLDSDYFKFVLDDDTLHVYLDMPNDDKGNYLTEQIIIQNDNTTQVETKYPIKVGSETVKWNGIILTRGEDNDYTIDGNIVKFHSDVELLKGDKIEVTYLK